MLRRHIYHERVAQRQDPMRLSPQAQRDQVLKPEVARVFAESFAVYGVHKVWRQIMREGFSVARCIIERLRCDMGLQGVIRSKPVRTTMSDNAAPCPLDHVNRRFYAPPPNMLWVSDFAYVATWASLVYVAVVIYTYTRRIVGWLASGTAHASFVLDALEQVLHDRQLTHRGGLIHHSDCRSQCVSIKYTERLADAGIEPPVGSVGDSYDNALADTLDERPALSTPPINPVENALLDRQRPRCRNHFMVAPLATNAWPTSQRMLRPGGRTD